MLFVLLFVNFSSQLSWVDVIMYGETRAKPLNIKKNVSKIFGQLVKRFKRFSDPSSIPSKLLMVK